MVKPKKKKEKPEADQNQSLSETSWENLIPGENTDLGKSTSCWNKIKATKTKIWSTAIKEAIVTKVREHLKDKAI
nr:hypothetical protein [Mycoplasmopsis bovis]